MIVAACDDGTVGIHDSVTGVLRLSLSLPHPIQTMAGSPDGSILFCTHRESPSITMWDIQTGGLVHTFTLTAEAANTAVSLSGRYLACGLSDGTVNVWEVANRMGGPIFCSGSPGITCLCWLAPEEQLMIATKESVHIRDIATGNALTRSLGMRDPVCDAVYSQKYDELAIVTSPGAMSFVDVIDAQTGRSSAFYSFHQGLSCIAFSQTTRQLVCGLKIRGAALVHVSGSIWMGPGFPATITTVSTLSNEIVVSNVAGSGIQLLILDTEYKPPQKLPPALIIHPLDKGKIIALIPISRDRVVLLQTATVSEVFTIPAQRHLSIPTDRTAVLCASLESKTAVHFFFRRRQRVPPVVGVWLSISAVDRTSKRTAICW